MNGRGRVCLWGCVCVFVCVGRGELEVIYSGFKGQRVAEALSLRRQLYITVNKLSKAEKRGGMALSSGGFDTQSEVQM